MSLQRSSPCDFLPPAAVWLRAPSAATHHACASTENTKGESPIREVLWRDRGEMPFPGMNLIVLLPFLAHPPTPLHTHSQFPPLTHRTGRGAQQKLYQLRQLPDKPGEAGFESEELVRAKSCTPREEPCTTSKTLQPSSGALPGLFLLFGLACSC